MARLRQLGLARLIVLISILSLPAFFQTARAAAKPDAASVADLVGRAVENYKAREVQHEKYTYLARMVRTEFGRNHKPKGHIIGTYEIMFLSGVPYRRLIRVNDGPLSPQMDKLEQQRLEAESKAREAGKSPQQAQTFFSVPVAQLTEGFRLRWRGQQVLSGREVQVIEAVPDHEYLPASPAQEYAHHFTMKVWIEPVEAQIVRVECRVVGASVAVDQAGIGFAQGTFSPDAQFSIRKYHVEVSRGTVSDMEWTKVNDEVWLPTRSYWKTAKMTILALSSTEKPLSFPVELRGSYSDYKKFRVDTRIVPK